MSDDLIARLKAAHHMSQCHARDYCGEPGDIHTSICRVVEEDLIFNEIIAALEERERMRAVVASLAQEGA